MDWEPTLRATSAALVPLGPSAVLGAVAGLAVGLSVGGGSVGVAGAWFVFLGVVIGVPYATHPWIAAWLSRRRCVFVAAVAAVVAVASVALVGVGWSVLEAMRDASPDAGGLAAGYALIGFGMVALGGVGAIVSVPALVGALAHRFVLGRESMD